MMLGLRATTSALFASFYQLYFVLVRVRLGMVPIVGNFVYENYLQVVVKVRIDAFTLIMPSFAARTRDFFQTCLDLCEFLILYELGKAVNDALRFFTDLLVCRSLFAKLAFALLILLVARGRL